MALNPNNLLLKFLSDRLGRSATNLELAPRLKQIGGKLPELTESEKKSIIDVWSRIAGNKIDFNYWRFFKAMQGHQANPMFVPDNIYWSRIIRALNPVSMTRTYINKSLYPIIFKGLRQPEILVNVFNGIHYNSQMDRISAQNAIDILYDYENAIIVKPTTATSGGHGVTKISKPASRNEITDILAGFGQNYICQGIVIQSESTAQFNSSSLNTFRVNTVNINGRTTCECLMMRHGLKGSIVDNFAVGGMACGMTTDGKFNGTNFNSKLELLTNLPDGTAYTSHQIPGIDKVINTAIESHQKFMPGIGHAAWDFAIDQTGNPIMIEVNLMLPGIIMEQLTSRTSIFGSRTEEVISYAIEKNKRVAWTEFVGGWA